MIDYFHPTSHPARPPREHPLLSAIADIGWMVLGLILVIALGGAVSVIISPVAGYLSPLGAMLLLVALALFAQNVRRSRALIAIGYLEQAVRLNLPLPAMITAAQSAERGALRRRLGRLRESLESGAPVGFALARTMPGVPARMIGMIVCGERLGQLPQVLGRVARRDRPPSERGTLQSIMLRWYPLSMFLCLIAVVSAVNWFVMPKYMRIFRDFKIEPPAITSGLLSFWSAAQTPLVLLGVLGLAVFCGSALSGIFPTRRRLISPWRGIVDRIAWLTPIWRAVVKSRVLADACHLLADALEIGQPMDRAVLEAAEACSNVILQNRTKQWGQAMSQGVGFADAARKAKMPALLVGMLSTARGADGAKQLFSFLARYYEGRFRVAAAIVQGAAIPIMVAVFGVFVAILALGLFLPLIKLADHLSGFKGVL